MSAVVRELDSTKSDLVKTRTCLISETAAGTTFTAGLIIPAGSILLDVFLIPVSLWTADTSASAIIGDTADPDGFSTAINLKATDLVLGERFRASQNWQWAGTNGAYLVSATGRFGAASGNGVSGYYAAQDTITATVTRVGTSGAAGRTYFGITWAPLYSVAANT